MNFKSSRQDSSRGCNNCKRFRSKPFNKESVELYRARGLNTISKAAGLDEIIYYTANHAVI
jgi:hypothetical protein